MKNTSTCTNKLCDWNNDSHTLYSNCPICGSLVREASKSDGMKFDDGKPQYHLIDDDFEEGLALVLTHGVITYKEDDWKKVVTENPKRYYSALRRHIKSHRKAMRLEDKHAKDEYFDEDSGLLHIEHAIACLMILHWNCRQDLAVRSIRAENIKTKTYMKKGGDQTAKYSVQEDLDKLNDGKNL